MIVENREEWLQWLYATFSPDWEREEWEQAPPKEYPCYCMTEVQSWGMQESRPVYIYWEDVKGLAPTEATAQAADRAAGGESKIKHDYCGDLGCPSCRPIHVKES